MKKFQFLSTIKFLPILNIIFIPNHSFAERNENVSETCAQFQLSASQPPKNEVTFTYYNTPQRMIYRTYYKDEASGYYSSLEDRQNKRSVMFPRGDISVTLLNSVSYEDYQSFFNSCNLFADETMLTSFGFILLESNFNSVVAAKALEESAWFATVYPMFILQPNH